MTKKIEPIDILIPTFNQPKMLSECLSSIGSTRLSYPVNVIVVNNGHPASLNMLGSDNFFRVVQTGGKNLGWEGGLVEGLKHSTSEFVMFANDDIFVPAAQSNWIRKMVETFGNKEVAGVGPSSNFVMGAQHMNYRTPYDVIDVPYLIGFCVAYRRSALDEAGGVDMNLPGGDDLDLSIRIRKKGHSLVCRRDVFVFHHRSVTGVQMFGGADRRGGWNSPQMTERTNHALIAKHGFRAWFECIAGYEYPERKKGDDHEGDIVRGHIVGDKIVELGCGNNKTVPHAVGVDWVDKGKQIPFLNATSHADVIADAEKSLPFPDGSQDTIIARHLLEHCIDTVGTLKNWMRPLRHGGKLIVAVPDETLIESIPMNGEHVHAFTANSLKSIGELVGLKWMNAEQTRGGSIVTVFERNGQ